MRYEINFSQRVKMPKDEVYIVGEEAFILESDLSSLYPLISYQMCGFGQVT